MPNEVRGPISLAGRILLCTIFLMSAIGNKIPNYGGVAGAMREQGVPLPEGALAVAILFLLAGSFSIILGFYARMGAALLLVFLVLATFFFHDFWTFADPAARSAQQIHFFKNVGLMGAMLMIIANDVGPWRMDSGLARSDAA